MSGRRSGRSREQGARPRLPLVGRDRELELLGRRDRPTPGAGSGGVIELVGETGSGKSRLLAEARKLGEGMRRAPLDVRGGTRARRRTSPGASCCASCSSVGWDDPEATVLARLDGRDRAQTARSAPMAAPDRDRPRRRRPAHDRGRAARRREAARPSCTRSCCVSSTARSWFRRSSRSSTRT